MVGELPSWGVLEILPSAVVVHAEAAVGHGRRDEGRSGASHVEARRDESDQHRAVYPKRIMSARSRNTDGQRSS